MSECEEQALLRALSCKVNNSRSGSIPASTYRLYRKLIVRKIKRKNNIPLFSVLSDMRASNKSKSRILDRYKVTELECLYSIESLASSFQCFSIPNLYSHEMMLTCRLTIINVFVL